jgi:hypothetical protein
VIDLEKPRVRARVQRPSEDGLAEERWNAAAKVRLRDTQEGKASLSYFIR